MKIEEVLKEENIEKVYEFNGERYLLIKIGTFLCLRREEDGEDIDEIHPLCVLVKGRFKEVIDWSKIPVDTKLLVSKDGERWHRRHFAEYRDGKVYCFNSGFTSFTIEECHSSHTTSWEYFKLYQEKEELMKSI